MVESNSKKTHARAKREGWRVEADAPFVAYPDGTKREANEDEKIMFARGDRGRSGKSCETLRETLRVLIPRRYRLRAKAYSVPM